MHVDLVVHDRHTCGVRSHENATAVGHTREISPLRLAFRLRSLRAREVIP